MYFGISNKRPGELEHYEEGVGNKKLCDAYFVKAKALLAGCRPVQAKRVCNFLLLLVVPATC